VPKTRIQIIDLSFRTRRAAIEHFRRMLHRYDLNERVSEQDAIELRWLLDRHHEREQKVGRGIDYFVVRRNPEYPTQCGFFIVRADGAGTDLSYLKCIDGKAPAPMLEAKWAMRAEVRDDIRGAKQKYFDERADEHGQVKCPSSGKLITIEEADADRAPPRTFDTLALAFLEARGIKADATFVTPSTDNQYEPRMVDRELAAAWLAYHHKLSAIRVVARGEYLTRGHESKVKKADRQLDFSARPPLRPTDVNGFP
jgi:hypothetical protein